jgi:squalene synthase HpnC
VSDLTELAAADAYCRYLANRHYENFSVAARILPADLRVHLARIYAFCRSTDDLGDESGMHGLDRLTSWQDQLAAYFERRVDPIHPVLLALSRSIEELDLPAEPFFDLIRANIQDQTVTAYATWEDLERYCLWSAAPVGRLVLRVFGVHDPAAVPFSDDVCIGLQLANFAQDVAVDRRKGRTYLIGSELEALGMPGAVAAMCDRAQHLLESGRQLETMVPRRLGWQLALYRLGGTAIVAAIRRTGYRTDLRRPTVSPLEKVKLVPLALMQTARRHERVPARHPA